MHQCHLSRARSALLAASALLLLARTARAQETAPPPAPEAAPAEVAPGTPEGEKGDKKKKKDKDKDDGKVRVGDLEVKGRVFAVAEYADTEDALANQVESLDFSVPSARLGARYEMLDWLSLSIEADFGGKVELKDGFIQARSKHARGRAGQFKMPISSITLESPWTLPIARRGMIQDLLTDHMQVVGRRPGFQGTFRLGGGFLPQLTLGLFQGSQKDTKGRAEPLEDLEVDSQNAYARLFISPGPHDIALVAGRTTTKDGAGSLQHFSVFGGDATLDFEGTGFRAWAEVLAGKTWYTAVDAMGIATGILKDTYLMTRAILAWRWGGAAEGDFYVEPFVLYGRLDPASDIESDVFWEGFLGVAVGSWRKGRLTLQAELGKGGDKIPPGLFFGGRSIRDHKAVLLQAGAAF